MKTSKHPKLANGQPVISCFTISLTELVRRSMAAHERAQEVAAQQGATSAADFVEELTAAGRNQLWHADFPTGLKLLVCDNELFRLTADLPSQLLEANGGQPLDFFDYGYVADVLREWVTDAALLPGEGQLMRRALAWVEKQGSGLLAYSQPA
jgi:hypothetical protein